MSQGRSAVIWKWIIISLLTGPATALTVAGFLRLLPVFAAAAGRLVSFAPWLAPLLGAALTGTMILRYAPGAGGEGIPSYLLAVNRDRGAISLRDTVLKLPATLVTLGSHGSGGIVGPLSRIGAGIGSHLTRLVFRTLRIREQGMLRVAAICGVSGMISSIFHAPLAGGLFAAEILFSDTLRYSDLFPSILTGYTAYITTALVIGDAPVFHVTAPPAPGLSPYLLLLPLVAAVAGAAGMLFIFCYEKADAASRRLPFGQPGRAMVSGAILCVVWLLGFEPLLATSPGVFASVASGDLATLAGDMPLAGRLAFLLLVILVLKIVVTAVTVGGGLSAGFTGPMIITGVVSGGLMATVAGIVPGSPAYFMVLSCSTAAVLGAALNVPVAAILIVSSIFGSDYLPSAATGGVLAFVIFRNRTIYKYSISSWPPATGGRG